MIRKSLLLLTFLFQAPTWSTNQKYNSQALGGFAISEDLLIYLLKTMPAGKTILELGSGSGTGELARFYTMHSIEHAEGYLNRYNSHYIFEPIKHYKNYQWYDVEVLKQKLPTQYDLILVDGPPGSIGREGFLHNLYLFNTNVTIILDDVQRGAELNLLRNLSRVLKKPFKIVKCSDNKAFGIIE